MRPRENRDCLLKCNGPSTIRRSSYNEMGGQTPVVIITPDIQNNDNHRRKNKAVYKSRENLVPIILYQKYFFLKNFFLYFREQYNVRITSFGNQIHQKTIK